MSSKFYHTNTDVKNKTCALANSLNISLRYILFLKYKKRCILNNKKMLHIMRMYTIPAKIF